MARGRRNENFANWNVRVGGIQQSSDQFYTAVEKELKRHNIDRLVIRRVDLSEYGILSSKREYLEVYFAGYVFHLCLAPFGDGCFVSWWCGQVIPWITRVFDMISLVGRFFRWLDGPETYYRIDIAIMFQSVVHDSVLYVLDELAQLQAKEPIPLDARKPRMRDFLA